VHARAFENACRDFTAAETAQEAPEEWEMRRVLPIVGAVWLAACGQQTPKGVKAVNLPEHIISLERTALDRWVHADPDGYLSLYTKDATYFDPFRDKRAGLDELNELAASMRGVKPPFTEPRYDMINPTVVVDGNIAVLTYNLVNYGKPTGKTDEAVLARWNATQVYRQIDGAWQLLHTHWSFTQPKLAAAPF
jgi:uncharacterized protein (TIGR02246 family)